MNVLEFTAAKHQRKLITATCYDYTSAVIAEKSPLDAVLVGDSLGCVIYGHPNTTQVTMDMMVLHTSAVAKGLKETLLIADLPFLSYRQSLAHTMHNVMRLVQAGAQTIKLEGTEGNLDTISHIVASGIPIMGHIGLTPQLIHSLGGHRVQGRKQAQIDYLCQQAKQLESAGCFAIVIEGTPPSTAKQITDSIQIPTIGIGAGPDTDGQILLWHDILGLFTDFKPKFVKHYLSGSDLMQQALTQFSDEVAQGIYPDRNTHCYKEKEDL